MPNIVATEGNTTISTSQEVVSVVENGGDEVVIVVDPNVVEIITTEETTIVVLAEGPQGSPGVAGPQGPMGVDGVPGPQGPSGGSGTYFVWNQSSPASIWNIVHDLNKRPSITIVDSSGRVVFGDVDYISDTQITVSFVGSFSGIAYLN